MWRLANPSDDVSIVRMCLALYAEDPGTDPVSEENIRKTLRALRERPARGRAMALELEGRVCGYALLISFWSNELGGEIDVIDELYVEPAHRSRGHATRFIETLATGSESWTSSAVALDLEITSHNLRARGLYERLGFQTRNLTMHRRLPR